VAILVLDAGVLIAHERGDRTAAAWLARAAREGVDLAVAAPTIAEAEIARVGVAALRS
jgi:predicted nucleic acid-binding protein